MKTTNKTAVAGKAGKAKENKSKNNTSTSTRKAGKAGKAVSNSELENVIVAASAVAAPAGAGVGSSAQMPDTSRLGVGVSAAGAAATEHKNSGAAPAVYHKAKQTGDSQLVAAVLREGVNDYSILSLRSRIAEHFAPAEWSGAAAVRAALQPLVDSGVMDSASFDAALAGAARKAGIRVPLVSAARVLAVVRSHYLNEFETLTGCKFTSALDYVKRAGLGTFALLLPLGLVRADSSENDFVAVSALSEGVSAAGFAGALLSFRFLAAFRAARAAARAVALSRFNSFIESAVREGLALGLTADEMKADFAACAEYVPVEDSQTAARLERNLASVWGKINALNDNILRAGGAGWLDYKENSDTSTSTSSGRKAAKIRKLLAKRARLQSAAATLEASLARC